MTSVVLVLILILGMVVGLFYMGTLFFEATEHISKENEKYKKNPETLIENSKSTSTFVMSEAATQIKHRSPVAIIILSIVTLGVYVIYWTVKTKEEIKGLGATIPTAWLLIVPFANIYFAYRYAEGFSVYVKKDNSPVFWFLVHLFIWPIFMIFVQIWLNKYAIESNSVQQGLTQ